MKDYPMNMLPNEMREVVYAKVEARTLMKLMQLDSCSRKFVMRHGPFLKPFERIEISVHQAAIEYRLYSSTSANSMPDYNLKTSSVAVAPQNTNNRFPDAEKLRKVLKLITSTKSLSIEMHSNTGSADRFLPEFTHLLNYQLIFWNFEQLESITGSFQPKVVDQMTFTVRAQPNHGEFGASISADRKGVVAKILQSGLHDCLKVNFNREFELFHLILMETNVQTILVDLDANCPLNVAATLLVQHGVITKHPQAELYIRGNPVNFFDAQHVFANASVITIDESMQLGPICRVAFHEATKKYWNVVPTISSTISGQAMYCLQIFQDFWINRLVFFLHSADRNPPKKYYFSARYFDVDL